MIDPDGTNMKLTIGCPTICWKTGLIVSTIIAFHESSAADSQGSVILGAKRESQEVGFDRIMPRGVVF